jgi:DNA-binding XRE family transcriptional regulator
MTVQYIEVAGQQLAVLPAEDLRRLLDAVEEQEDISLAIEAETRREGGEEYLPAAMVNRLLDGENALRVWREYRSLTLAQLSGSSGVNKASISLLENGKAQGKPATWRALADALKVSVDDILPLE